MATTRNVNVAITDPDAAGPGERIVTFATSTGDDTGRGGYISVRHNDDGTVAVNVYGCDPGVTVAVEGRYPHIAHETTLGDYAMLPARLRNAVAVAAYNEFLATRGRVAGYFAAEAAVQIRQRYPAASVVTFRIASVAGDAEMLAVTNLAVYDAAGAQVPPNSDHPLHDEDARIRNTLAAAAEFGDSRYFPHATDQDGDSAVLVLDDLFNRTVHPET
jgi:hypothetical protein